MQLVRHLFLAAGRQLIIILDVMALSGSPAVIAVVYNARRSADIRRSRFLEVSECVKLTPLCYDIVVLLRVLSYLE